MVQFLYKKLKQERKEKNLTIKELSEQSNVSAGMISSIERGLVNPSVDLLFKISNVLGLPVDHFLPSVKDRHELFILKRQDQYYMSDENGYSYFASPVFEKK